MSSAPTYIYPPLDSDPAALYQLFATFMASSIDNWKAYSGELDDWIARAVSGQVSTLTELASDVATTIYRYFGANILGVAPYPASVATSTITATVQDATGYTIPAFTPMSFADGNGNLQDFETLVDSIVPAGQTTLADIAVQAVTPGSGGNGCTGSAPVSPLTFVTGLTLDAPTANGTDAESDTAYLNRLTLTLTTLTPTPITVAQFTTLLGTQEGVGRATTIGAFNPANWTVSATLASNETVTVASTANIPQGATVSGTGIPANTYITGITDATHFTISNAATASGAETLTIAGQINQGGYVTSWAVDANGAPLTSGAMTALTATMQAKCLVGVSYSVQAPTSNTINVVVNGACWPGTDVASIEAAVQAAVNSYLQPGSFGQPINPIVTAGQQYGWLNDNYVRSSALEALVMNVPGMHYVSSLTINGSAGDCALEGIVPITEPGSITVTLVNA